MPAPHRTRRDFLKTSTATVSAAALGSLAVARGAHAAGSDVIRIGMVGCGSRCPGAAVNAMNVDPGVRLVAMTDIFPERVTNRRETLKKQKGDQVQVDDAHCFSGLDGYKHVIESVDVVFICGRPSRPASTSSSKNRTPSIRPGFMPWRPLASWPRRKASV